MEKSNYTQNELNSDESPIKQIIEGASAYIEARTEQGKGPWMEGLKQLIYQIECLLPAKADPIVIVRLEDLKTRAAAVFTTFGESTFVPDEGQKSDFLTRVNIYAPHYPDLLDKESR